MDHFTYRNGELFCENIRATDLAGEFGTPLYVYSKATLEMHVDRMAAAFAQLKPLICFAVKACPNVNVLRVLARRGLGMDVVSEGELYRARVAGVSPDKIVFAGVGKTVEEIRSALAGGRDPRPVPAASEPIAMFNVESEQELDALASAARAMGVMARAAIRVHPNVKAGGHDYISTGTEETKFGVDLATAGRLIRRFARDKHVRLSGLHLHIGSLILDTAPYVEALRRVLALMDELAGEGVAVDTLDLGGGFGADYSTGDSPSAADFAAAIVPMLADRVRGGLRIIFEPGRSIVANAGVLLSRVVYVKTGGPGPGSRGPAGKKFVIADAGMNVLIRPALYESFHFIWPASVSPQHEPPRRAEKPDVPGLEVCDVVGPICESGDFLAKGRPLPPIAKGEVLAVFGAGAYGMSMASRYNSHPLPAEVLVDGSQAALIRRRETLEDLVAHEIQEPRKA